ncbi:unnamed protein product, partial [Amoebophrya sp. A25]|eukprot:GSA25T00009854001.1
MNKKMVAYFGLWFLAAVVGRAVVAAPPTALRPKLASSGQKASSGATPQVNLNEGGKTKRRAKNATSSRSKAFLKTKTPSTSADHDPIKQDGKKNTTLQLPARGSIDVASSRHEDIVLPNTSREDPER